MQIEVPAVERIHLRCEAKWPMYEGPVTWSHRQRMINHGLCEGPDCKRRHQSLVLRWHALYWSA